MDSVKITQIRSSIRCTQDQIRTLRALGFRIVFCKLTWPSPATTTCAPLRTDRIVVPCQTGAPD